VRDGGRNSRQFSTTSLCDECIDRSSRSLRDSVVCRVPACVRAVPSALGSAGRVLDELLDALRIRRTSLKLSSLITDLIEEWSCSEFKTVFKFIPFNRHARIACRAAFSVKNCAKSKKRFTFKHFSTFFNYAFTKENH